MKKIISLYIIIFNFIIILLTFDEWEISSNEPDSMLLSFFILFIHAFSIFLVYDQKIWKSKSDKVIENIEAENHIIQLKIENEKLKAELEKDNL